MLIVVAFVPLAAALVVLFTTARNTRTLWPVAALLVASAILFALHARAWTREKKRLDASISDSCRYLASEIEMTTGDYQSILWTPKDKVSPVDVLRVRDRYTKIMLDRRDWLAMCSASCLPPVLNERTVDDIARAAAAIGNRKLCP